MPASHIARVARQTKPQPLVPKPLCEGFDERVTLDGQVFAALNKEMARVSLRRLDDQGVEAIANSLVGSWTVNSADMADCVRFVAAHGVEVDEGRRSS